MLLCFMGSIAVWAMGPFALVDQQLVRMEAPVAYHGMNPEFLDRSTKPVDDFYRFSCGSWLDRIKIPTDQPLVSAAGQARQRNEELMWKVIAPTIGDSTAVAGTPEQLVGEFIRTGMDEDLANRLRCHPIQSELDRIARIQTHGDVVEEIARLQRWHIGAGFTVQVDFDYADSSHKTLRLWEGGLSLRGRSPYLKADPQADQLKEALSRCVRKSLSLLGDTSESLVASAHSVLELETKIAAAWVPQSETSCIESSFHTSTKAQLEALAPNLDWDRYFRALGAGSPESIDVGQPGYLKAFDVLLAQTPVADWKNYLRWHLVSAASPYLSDDFVQQSFDLRSALTGQRLSPNRRESVLEEADASLGSELGQLLARTGYAINSKKRVLSMVHNIRAALHDMIDGLDWMAPVTKAKALDKLERMQVQVCYPEHWRDSSGLVVQRDSYLQNVFRAREFEFQRQLDGLTKPVDRGEWDMRAYAADARYEPSLNEIVLPAGLLQPPFFDNRADDASNYGTFGVLIGHEMMHGFDSRGRKFDAEGNLNTWWTAADTMRFDEHEKAIVSQYDGYSLCDHLAVNGKLTLEENVADLGGVLVSYAAFQHAYGSDPVEAVDGYSSDQRFFIAFAQLFRSKSTEEWERLSAETDPHSPPRYRVMGVLQNVPEFWKAFAASPPKPILRIW